MRRPNDKQQKRCGVCTGTSCHADLASVRQRAIKSWSLIGTSTGTGTDTESNIELTPESLPQHERTNCISRSKGYRYLAQDLDIGRSGGLSSS